MRLLLQVLVFIGAIFTLLTWKSRKYVSVYVDDIGLVRFYRVFPMGFECEVLVSDPYIQSMYLYTSINHSNPEKVYGSIGEKMFKVMANGTHVLWKYRSLVFELAPGQEILFWFTGSLEDTRLENIISKKWKLFITADKTFVMGTKVAD